jgi:pilus assembly protein CpaD
MSSRQLIALLPVLLAGTLAMSGCNSQDIAGTPDLARWSTTEASHENKVDFVRLNHSVLFLPNSSLPAPGETAALNQFLAQLQLSYADQVTIETAPPYGVAASGALAVARADAITAIVHKFNVAVEANRRTSQIMAAQRDEISVVVGRYVVTTPACPDWRKPEGDDYTNSPSSDYGCATETNLGLMVANPGDLLHGTTTSTADGEFSARAVEQYRKGMLTKSLAPELSGAVAGAPSGGGGLGTSGQ